MTIVTYPASTAPSFIPPTANELRRLYDAVLAHYPDRLQPGAATAPEEHYAAFVRTFGVLALVPRQDELNRKIAVSYWGPF